MDEIKTVSDAYDAYICGPAYKPEQPDGNKQLLDELKEAKVFNDRRVIPGSKENC